MTTQAGQPPRRWKPLLVIPAVVFLAKAASRRRKRWASEAGVGGATHRHGHGRRFGVGPDGSVQLPPKIEAVLGAWHAQAHAATADAGPEPDQDAG